MGVGSTWQRFDGRSCPRGTYISSGGNEGGSLQYGGVLLRGEKKQENREREKVEKQKERRREKKGDRQKKERDTRESEWG